MQRMFGDLSDLISGEDELREIWSKPETRKKFLDLLSERGYDEGRLEDMRRLIDATDSDVFDVLAYVRFTLALMTRHARADTVREGALSVYQQEMRKFLIFVLSAYEKDGEKELDADKIGGLLKIRYGTTADAKSILGEVASIRQAFVGFQRHLYQN